MQPPLQRSAPIVEPAGQLGVVQGAIPFPPLDGPILVTPTHPIALGAGRVKGIVVDERGFPIEWAMVVIEGGAFRGEAQSDRRGEFAIDDVPDGKLTLLVTHRDHPRARVDGVVAGDDVRVPMILGGGIEGEVRDQHTRDVVRGVRVLLESGGEQSEAAILENGQFRLLACRPGAGTLRVWAPGYIDQALTVDVPTGETIGELTLRDVRVALVKRP